MTTKRLPGVNYNTRITNSDQDFDQKQDQVEWLERTQLAMGHPDHITATAWGIVANTDPADATTDDTLPLVVSPSSGQLTVDIRGGYVVTYSGFRINLISNLLGVSLSSADVGVPNFVSLKYHTANNEYQSTTDFQHSAYKWRVTPADENLIAVYTQTEWNALSLEDQHDHVVIAVVTPQIGAAGTKELNVDLSNTNYTFNRPWFSSVDVQHRSKVGSGTVSDTNVHGVGLNELNMGGFTLPQLMNQGGVVAAKPTSVARVPGRVCTITVPNGSIKTDTIGWYGSGAGAKYIELPYFPIRLGRVANAADTSKEFAWRIVPGFNIIVQATDLVAVPTTEDLEVTCIRADTLEPLLVGDAVTKFEAKAIQSDSIAIAAGKVYTNTSSVTLVDSMGDAGPIPMQYSFYFQEGEVIKNPQVLVCRTLVSDIGSGIIPTITQYGVGYMMVCLDKASAGGSLSVKVRFSGTDPGGLAISELVTFDGSWAQGPVVPSCATPTTQIKRVGLLFGSVTSITLEESLNAGADAAIQVWNAMDPTITPEMRYACPLAQARWDGVKFCESYDARNVVADLQHLSPDTTLAAAAAAIDERRDPSDTFIRRVALAESFETPVYGNLVRPSDDDWWYESGNISTSPQDGTQPGLWGWYQSRAIPRQGTALTGLAVRLIPDWGLQSQSRTRTPGTLINNRVGPLVSFSEQLSPTSWGPWKNQATHPFEVLFLDRGFPLDFGVTEVIWVGLTTSKAFRMRIFNGFGYAGYLIIEDY